ncbi:aminotransferase class I/II-fold pyridoxal phosphate-dependent enzyme [Lentibacillus sp. CBA3610]|uniref:aminotransferase class I/II-fold pyridoxal phosphate-dependent enzyme n=1 Tax=Lentibacillus sp. CBA3610 TaxID=2518176 RepID=UPI0015960863|nr:aminotransferase class I/II-fold pyridoxal phosphate-dependent enzyme [Lentibacillus sp. CBA3610]QKY70870.1 aminotransferase class I/II-fold pyridoxal phosphate-dependent enzyme [Lentibacillus sp. CBA3610]
MSSNQEKTPLYDALKQFAGGNPMSFHVPGHKHGTIFPEKGREFFESVLPLDMTELTGLDDLHATRDVIYEAQELAADFFGADATHFLIGGSTAGNLAMILSVCSAGDKVIVQRNSHKSIFNGLELGGARPVLIAPEFDESLDRYTAPDIETITQALQQHPDAKAVVLTYPDYFGKTFALREIIELIHEYNIPVLVDEAHGVHFSLSGVFPDSAVRLGADAVVQSAHKTTPAMTMGALLHIQSERIASHRTQHYLQMIQSSSPSYPIMASLDLARYYLANLPAYDMALILDSARQVRAILDSGQCWDLLSSDDPLKMTLQAKPGISGNTIAGLFEQEGIYPELSTHHQLLLIHGLGSFTETNKLKNAVKRITAQLKNIPNRDIIDTSNLFKQRVTVLDLDYSAIEAYQVTQIPLRQAENYIAAEAIIPYPPGIPLVLKGERITLSHIKVIEQFIQQGVTIQHRHIDHGISVFCTSGLQRGKSV